MPRFYLLHDSYTHFVRGARKQRPLDIMQEHTRFQTLFSTHYNNKQSLLAKVKRYAGPIPSDSTIAQYLPTQSRNLTDHVVR